MILFSIRAWACVASCFSLVSMLIVPVTFKLSIAKLLRNIAILITSVDSVYILQKPCVWEISCHEGAFKTLHFTWTVCLYCVLLISLISTTDTGQILDIACCSVSCRSNNIHKWLTNFNLLPNLTSLFLTACEGTALSVHYSKIYIVWGYMPLALFLGARFLFVFSFKLPQIYPQFHLNSKLFGFVTLFAWFGQKKTSCAC